jgi:hypothetical protein
MKDNKKKKHSVRKYRLDGYYFLNTNHFHWDKCVKFDRQVAVKYMQTI